MVECLDELITTIGPIRSEHRTCPRRHGGDEELEEVGFQGVLGSPHLGILEAGKPHGQHPSPVNDTGREGGEVVDVRLVHQDGDLAMGLDAQNQSAVASSVSAHAIPARHAKLYSA